jgi:hypothetical protein
MGWLRGFEPPTLGTTSRCSYKHLRKQALVFFLINAIFLPFKTFLLPRSYLGSIKV